MAIEQKRMSQISDISSELLLYDPILLAGEMMVEEDSKQLKIGSGTNQTYSVLPYFNPATLTPLAIGGTAMSTGASLCGTVLRIQNASSFTLTLLSGDLSQASTPVGITSHFPLGGYFHVMFDHDVTAATTFTVTAGPNNDFWSNEYGSSSNTVSSASRNFNNGEGCQGKLYRVEYIGGSRWQVWEMDTKDVWEAAKIQLPSYPSYGGYQRAVAGALPGVAVDHDITFAGALSSNSGVDTTNFATGLLGIVTPGDYWLKGDVVIITSSATPTLILRLKIDGVDIGDAVVEYAGTSPIFYTYMSIDTVARVEAFEDITLTLRTGAAEQPIIQFAHLIAQKLDLRTET